MSPIIYVIEKIKDAVAYVADLVAQAKDAWPRYRKFLVAAAGFVVLAAGAILGETSPEYIAIVSALTALGVRQVPNAEQ